MARTHTVVRSVLRVALVLVGVGVAGYVALMVLLFYSLQEPYPFLDVRNESGRPLLVEQVDLVRSPGAGGPGLLTWRGNEGWHANTRGCEQTRLVARDLQGTAVAERTGACRSDTWTITGEGLSPAPRPQRTPVPVDQVEARLVLGAYGTQLPVVAWWRELPETLHRAATTGRQEGVTVDGPFVEDDELTLYVRGPSATRVVEFARTQVLRPSPGPVDAYVSAPGSPAPQTGRPVVLDDATTRPNPHPTPHPS